MGKKKKTPKENPPLVENKGDGAEEKIQAKNTEEQASGEDTTEKGIDVEQDFDEEDLPVNMNYDFFETVEISDDKKEKYFERPVSSKEEIQEIKQKMEDDVNNVKKIMIQLEEYFQDKVDQIGINHREFEITIPIEYMNMKFVTILAFHPNWIFIKCKVLDLEDVPEKVKFELYEKILSANFELNAVFYSIDPELKGIWIENDLAIPGLNMESFDIKFNAIIFGIKFFVDNIALPLNQEVKSTFQASSMYT